MSPAPAHHPSRPRAALRRLALAALAALALAPAGAGAAETLRVYYIGNSVTDSIRYDAFASLAAGRGDRLVWARHMVPGAPLFFLWQNGGAGFFDADHGSSRTALGGETWDLVTVQPFDRDLVDEREEGDLQIIQQMLNAQLARNPAVRFYVFSRWPRMVGHDGKALSFDPYDYDPARPAQRPDLRGIKPWTELWERGYRAGVWDGSQESRDYFEQVVNRLRAANPGMQQPVRMIPVGDVFHALERKMRAGGVPGFDNVWLLYKDGIHVNNHGSYLTALTFYATLLGRSPVGLPSGAYGTINPELARVFQQTVWEVVSAHPLAGVAKAR